MASAGEVVDEFGTVARNAVGDHATATDTLGFSPYVEAVVAFLTSPQTVPPLTMSVEGEWGSGKSSFLLQVEQRIAGASQRDRFLEHLPRWCGGEAEGGSFWRAMRESRRPSPPTIRFNAWRHDKQDALWAAFALSVARRLRRRIGWSRALRADLYLLTKRLKGLRGFLELALLVVSVAILLVSLAALGHHLYRNGLTHEAGVLARLTSAEKTPSLYELLLSSEAKFHNSWIGLLLLSLVGLLKFWNQVKLPISVDLKKYLSTPDYRGHAAFIEDFHEDFAQLVNAYAGGDRVYIFIDDLDRCDVPRAAELMQAINLMIADAGNLVFVIGMDREKVAAGLTQKYKDLLPYLPDYVGVQPGPGWLGFGYSYLEKFIQLSFTLPVMADDTALDRFLQALAPAAIKPGWTARVGSYWGPRLRYARDGNRGASQAGPAATAFSAAQAATQSRAEARRDDASAQVRIQRLRFQISSDSAGIHTVVRMVSGVFESNPRRLKQFLSTYRLALAVTEAQGILTRTPHLAGVTPQQLGKFVALTMRFPELRTALTEQDPRLLATLEWEALHWTQADVQSSPSFHGLREKAVRSLLASGVPIEEGVAEGEPEPAPNAFSLMQLDTSRLMSLLPKAAPEPERPEPTAKPPASSSRASTGGTAPPETGATDFAPETVVENAAEVFLTTLHQMSAEYEEVRHTQPFSMERTERLDRLVNRIRQLTQGRGSGDILMAQQTMLQIDRDGTRIVAIGIAAAAVDAWNLAWLIDFLRNYRTWFEHYWTIQALLLHEELLDAEAGAQIASILQGEMDEIAKDAGRYQYARRLLQIATARSGPLPSPSAPSGTSEVS